MDGTELDKKGKPTKGKSSGDETKSLLHHSNNGRTYTLATKVMQNNKSKEKEKCASENENVSIEFKNKAAPTVSFYSRRFNRVKGKNISPSTRQIKPTKSAYF